MVTYDRQENRTQSRHLVSHAKPDWAIPQVGHTKPQLLARQQTLGNQAVQRLLCSRAIQAKLATSDPGDRYEQEAARVVEQVMRMPEPDASKETAASDQVQGVRIQRMCS